MGIKTFKGSLAVVTLLLMLSMDVHAATVSDVYVMYNKELTSMYPEDVLNTISTYQRYQRNLPMYKYVEKSQFDNKLVKDRIKSLKSKLKLLEADLVNAYDLPLDQIYILEDEYSRTKSLLQDAKNSAKVTQINIPDSSQVPTEEQYNKALADKEKIDSETDIGVLPIQYPVSGASKVLEKTDKHLTLSVDRNESVSPILNGTVLAVTNDSVTVSHGCGLYTYYGGLCEVLVEKGDGVYQGQNLGYTTETVTFKVRIQDEILDVSKLFQEG